MIAKHKSFDYDFFVQYFITENIGRLESFLENQHQMNQSAQLSEKPFQNQEMVKSIMCHVPCKKNALR